VDDVPGAAIERRQDTLPRPRARGELVRAVGARLARAARTLGPVTLPVAAWWIVRQTVRPVPSGALRPGGPWRGGPGAIVVRWAEATTYRSGEHGRLERRSFGAARLDIEP
jgi:hypothetical protein